MEKNFYYNELFDLYGELLTDKQREIFISYYVYDLSLSEIAGPLGKTRQSVHDAVKGVCEKLIAYEKILKVYEKNQRLLELAKNSENQDFLKKISEIIGK